MFADIETTGFSREWDAIIEIAAIIVNDENWNEIAIFHEYIKPYKKIPLKIEEHTGITNDFVESARKEEDVLMDFFEWVSLQNPDNVVGHNYITFDGQFFDTRAEKFGLNSFTIPIIDTLKIARSKKIPVKMTTATGKPSYKQESLANYYGIVYQAHSAIEDVRALIKIYKNMTGKDSDIKTAREELGF